MGLFEPFPFCNGSSSQAPALLYLALYIPLFEFAVLMTCSPPFSLTLVFSRCGKRFVGSSFNLQTDTNLFSNSAIILVLVSLLLVDFDRHDLSLSSAFLYFTRSR